MVSWNSDRGTLMKDRPKVYVVLAIWYSDIMIKKIYWERKDAERYVELSRDDHYSFEIEEWQVT